MLLGAGVALVLCCGGGAVVSMNTAKDAADDLAKIAPTATSGTTASSGDAAPSVEASAKAAPRRAGLGAPARDGKFEFVVQKVECGKAKVGEVLSKTAQGQFCLVTMSIKNIGDKPQRFSDSSQKAFSDKNAEYAADSAASMYANEDQQVLLNEINPGNTLNGTIVFDIPKDAKISHLELHDSPFSGGVEVSAA